MNEHSQKAADTASIGLAITACFVSFTYFVVVIWWSGIVQARHAEEVLKFENCYQRWAFDTAHQRHWLVEDYCSKGDTQ